jgi:hypothetical protein
VLVVKQENQSNRPERSARTQRGGELAEKAVISHRSSHSVSAQEKAPSQLAVLSRGRFVEKSSAVQMHAQRVVRKTRPLGQSGRKFNGLSMDDPWFFLHVPERRRGSRVSPERRASVLCGERTGCAFRLTTHAHARALTNTHHGGREANRNQCAVQDLVWSEYLLHQAVHRAAGGRNSHQHTRTQPPEGRSGRVLQVERCQSPGRVPRDRVHLRETHRPSGA